jgi:hypothetical protein
MKGLHQMWILTNSKNLVECIHIQCPSPYAISLEPASFAIKTGRDDIAEILLKVTLNTKNKKINQWGNQKP